MEVEKKLREMIREANEMLEKLQDAGNLFEVDRFALYLQEEEIKVVKQTLRAQAETLLRGNGKLSGTQVEESEHEKRKQLGMYSYWLRQAKKTIPNK